MAPLTEMTGDVPFKWTRKCQWAFDKVKAVLTSDCMNLYSDLQKPFMIICDASDYLQDGYPIAYWSKTLSPAQKHYTTTEKELLAIVLTLKEYRLMLLGGDLKIYTDHKNLIFRTLFLERVLQWRMYGTILLHTHSNI